MATLFRSKKLSGLWIISDGPLGKYTGHYKIARPYNRRGESIILDFKRDGPKFSDFIPVATVETHLAY